MTLLDTLYLNETKYQRWDVAPVPVPQYFRHPHDREIKDFNAGLRTYIGDWSGPVRNNAANTGKTIPEVYRMFPDQQTRLYPDHLKLWRELNWEFKDDILSTLIVDNFAWTNNTADIPAFHAPLLCGGAILRGGVDSGYLWIDSLLTSEPVPPAEIILNKPWLWYYGTEVNPDGVVTYITRMAKDGTRKPVRVPILSRLPLYLPLVWLHKLPLGFIPPSPLWRP